MVREKDNRALALIRKDDWLAVWAGFLILGLFLAGVSLKLPGWKWSGQAELTAVFSAANLRLVLPLFAGFVVLGAAGAALLRRPVGGFLLGAPILFALALAGFLVAGNKAVSFYGIEYVFWALLLGLVISNLIGVPRWLRAAMNTEFYIKIGLVLMGAEVLFRTLARAGAFGLVQALLVVVVVWYFCYWLAGRLGVDKEFSAILATGVSVCGVSAAIAAGGALNGDPKKVSHTISLVLIMAVPMLILQPVLARVLHLSALVAGAWLGGTIDTTGAVVAAGTIAGKEALDLAVIVKMAQNALIGVVAVLLAVWSVVRKKEGAEKPDLAQVWFRFPKFVLGFIVASLVFSLLLPEATAQGIIKVSSGLRGYWFCLAFVSIGLETNVKELVAVEGGRPALAFLGAQGLNLLWTLLIAGLIFGGLLFPVPRL